MYQWRMLRITKINRVVHIVLQIHGQVAVEVTARLLGWLQMLSRAHTRVMLYGTAIVTGASRLMQIRTA